jgi:hypothetical protein
MRELHVLSPRVDDVDSTASSSSSGAQTDRTDALRAPLHLSAGSSPGQTLVTALSRRCTRSSLKVWGAIALVAGVSIYFTATGKLAQLLVWMRDLGSVGAALLVLVYALCMVALVPGALLNIGAGFLYGTFYGYIVTVRAR